MRIYETTFIINPQTDDATIGGHVQNISNLITENSGKIVFEDHLGTRRMAYPIKKLTQGYYGSFIFESPPELLIKLERHYKQDEAYIRFLTVLFEGDLQYLTERKAAAEEVENVFNHDRDKSDERDTHRRPVHRRPENTKTVAEEKPPVPEPDTSEKLTEKTESEDVSAPDDSDEKVSEESPTETETEKITEPVEGVEKEKSLPEETSPLTDEDEL